MNDKPTMAETQEYFSGLIEKEEKQEPCSAIHPVSVPFYRLYEAWESLERLEAAEAMLKAAKADASFFRCCALSGETPAQGSEPSALNHKEQNS